MYENIVFKSNFSMLFLSIYRVFDSSNGKMIYLKVMVRIIRAHMKNEMCGQPPIRQLNAL